MCGGVHVEVDMWRCSCRGGYVECRAWMFCFIGHTRLRVDQSESCIVLLYKQEHGTLNCYCTIIPSRAEISRFYPNKYLQVSCLRTYFRVHHTLPYSTILLVPRTTLLVPRTTLFVLCKRAIGLAQWVWPGNEAVPIM